MFKVITMKLFVFHMIYDQNQSNYLERLRDCFPNVKSATYIQEAWTLHVCWTQTLLSLGSKGGWQCCPSGTAKRQYVTSMQRTGKLDQVPSTTLWSDLQVSERTWPVGKDVLSTSFGCFSMNFCAPWVCDKRTKWCFKLYAQQDSLVANIHLSTWSWSS